MRLPEIDTIATDRDMVTTFLGYNHNDTTNQYAPNQFYDMQNLTSDAYPSLAPRQQRAVIKTLEKANGLYAMTKLVYVDKGHLFYDGEEVAQLEDSEKKFVAMGANLVIFPDNVMYNTEDGTIKKLDYDYTTGNNILYTLSRMDGQDYEYYTGDTAPDTSEYIYWLDTSAADAVLKLWSESTQQWNSISTTYTKIRECPTIKVEGTEIHPYFIEPDYTKVGIGTYYYNMTEETLYKLASINGKLEWVAETKAYTVTKCTFANDIGEYDGINISGSDIEDFNTNMIIYDKGEDYIVVSGLLNQIHIQESGNPLTLNRKVPQMDFVCELDNRIWGCSSKKHEIYACKLGDPTNWESYAGLTSDSYALTVGSAGDFTGCIAHLGYVLFMKEECIHKLYGTAPENYTLTTINCRGLQKGSEKSLCVLNEVLYYKSTTAVCSFDGSLPSEISDDLGKVHYTDAVAGAVANKYYICMRDSNLKDTLFVYDTRRAMWHKEDNTSILYFADCEGGLYFIDADNRLTIVNKDLLYKKILPGMPYKHGNEISTIYPEKDFFPGMAFDAVTEEDFEWYAQTNIMGLDLPDNKYVSNITLRLGIEKGARFQVYIQYDSDGEWKKVFDINATGKRSFNIPIHVVRCDHFCLRLEGKGACKLFSYTKSIEQGSVY